MVCNWKKFLTPITSPRTYGFKVCDASGYFRCGGTCCWTVPTGVTEVQFQLWGHGSGNSGVCCCGGTPFGVTGSYAVATVPVTAGNGFCLYAGCAYCCYATQATNGVGSTETCVVDISVGNFSIVAFGACGNYQTWCNSIPFGVQMTNCGPPSNDFCNPPSCSGWNFCWDSAADNVYVPHMFSCSNVPRFCCNCRPGVCAYAIPSIFPAICIGSSLSGLYRTISGPVFGFENCTCTFDNSITPYAIENGYGGCYYAAQCGYQQIPAVGGYAGWTCAGSGSGQGDAGGMGMICVSWNC